MPLDFTAEKDVLGMRWILPFHALDPFFFATGGACVMEVRRSARSELLLRKISAAVDRGCRDKALQLVPHLVLLDRRFYREQLRPLLAQWMMLMLLHLRLRVLSQEEALSFLNGDGGLPQHRLMQLQADSTSLKMLNLSRELLDSIIPFVLSKVRRANAIVRSPRYSFPNSSTTPSTEHRVRRQRHVYDHPTNADRRPSTVPLGRPRRLWLAF